MMIRNLTREIEMMKYAWTMAQRTQTIKIRLRNLIKMANTYLVGTSSSQINWVNLEFQNNIVII